MNLNRNPPEHNLKQGNSESESLEIKVTVIYYKEWHEQGHLAEDNKQ